MTPPEPLGPALVQWNDYTGTAAADEGEAGTIASLYEISSLDPKAWTIVGLDLHVAGQTEKVTVYAFDRISHGVQSYAEVLDHADQTGELPVTAFKLSTSTKQPATILTLFKQVAIRLTTRGLRDQRLSVTEYRHLPSNS